MRVPGTRTAGSDDPARVDESLWPWITAAVPPPVQYNVAQTVLKRALKQLELIKPSDSMIFAAAMGNGLADTNVTESRIHLACVRRVR